MDSYIRIDGWKANIRFSSAHVIPEYEKCGRLHGHSYAIHAKLYGEKDEKGIIVDFSIIKHHLKMIADHLDHYILIPGNSQSISITDENNQITLNSLDKIYVFPKNDCIILPLSSTSAENLAHYVLEELLTKMENEIHLTKIEVGVDEGYGQGAFISKEL
ncbi:6-pyruvoyl tetrahydropterin synthase [Thermoplasmatales archaeon ex4572_165]|nr:MAG: 6-pyruvoyl tetrahydropterin synthase [Thermoplasmatales archaeon ex4572_165]RLF59864.1 MAG: 6-pyruvoyl tetrahydropterin synthase family protein [Thermoplasmata archaeon]